MFKKDFRLTKNKQFENVFKHGRSDFNKFLGVKIVKNELDFNRYGVIVSNKVSKKAVERSKIKRQLREILKKESIRITSGIDLVVIAAPPLKALSFLEIEGLIKNQLYKLKILKNNKDV